MKNENIETNYDLESLETFKDKKNKSICGISLESYSENTQKIIFIFVLIFSYMILSILQVKIKIKIRNIYFLINLLRDMDCL